MELRVLRYFLAVAREGSMTGAANFLHVTQPTLSRQLKELDEAQHIRQSDHDGTLAERAELEMRFGFHVSFLLNCDFVIWGSRI